MGKSRILVITRNLPPLRGGMERLNYHLLQELAQGFELGVCCPWECLSAVSPTMRAAGVPLRPLSQFILAGTARSIALARRFRPHLVLAGSGLTAPLARIAAASVNARSGAYLHGLDIAAEHWIYQKLWVRQFRALDLILVNSRHTAALAERVGVPAARINIVHPGVSLPAWEPATAIEFRQHFGLGDRPVLLSLGRLTSRKGLVEFLERVMPALVVAVPRIFLAVIGGEAVHSIKADTQSQWQRIQLTIQRLGLGEHVQLMGEQDDAMVGAAFFSASALVFPVLNMPGDSEGFGMVAVEAAAHGVPTVAFAVGGVVDAVADPESGSLAPSGDYFQMTEKLIELCRSSASEEARQRRRDFAANFEWSRFGEQVRKVCGGIVANSDAASAV